MPVPGADETLLRLRVIYLDPPDPEERQAECGLQDRAQQIHAGRQEGNDLCYDLEVMARWNPGRQQLRFRGPWVQGTPDAPFLYLSWRARERDAVPGPWLWRVKVSLADIGLSQVERARHAPQSVLVARIPARGDKGRQNSGTVRPLEEGWTLVDAADFNPIPPP
jgi:hypothetical protein